MLNHILFQTQCHGHFWSTADGKNRTWTFDIPWVLQVILKKKIIKIIYSTERKVLYSVSILLWLQLLSAYLIWLWTSSEVGMWLSVGLLAYIFTQYHQKKEEKRRKHLAGSPGRVLCCGTKKRYPEGRRSFCLGMDWDVWSESCYCCCLPGGFQAVSRASIETVATLVSAEKTIYRNCDKNVINSNATALHFIIIHFTATPL